MSGDNPATDSLHQETLELARALLAAGEDEAALAAVTAHLSAFPTSVAGYVARARCHVTLGAFDRALADVERASVLASSNPEPWFVRATLLLVEDDLIGASEAFGRAESCGGGAAAANALGDLHLRRGEDFEAAEDYGRAFAYESTNAGPLFKRGRIYMAHEYFVAALADFSVCCLMDEERAEYRVERGNAFYELGDFERATEDFRMALSLEAALPEVALNLGCMALDRDDLEVAITHFDAALELQPAYARALLNRGLAYYHQGRDEAARVDLERAVTLDPGDPDGAFALARVFARQRRYSAAVEHLAQALKTAPEYADEVYEEEVFEEVRKLGSVKRLLALAAERLPG